MLGKTNGMLSSHTHSSPMSMSILVIKPFQLQIMC